MGEQMSEKIYEQRKTQGKMTVKYGDKVIEPDPKCRHCYGRGYVAFKAGTADPVVCNCLRKRWKKEKEKELDEQKQ